MIKYFPSYEMIIKAAYNCFKQGTITEKEYEEMENNYRKIKNGTY